MKRSNGDSNGGRTHSSCSCGLWEPATAVHGLKLHKIDPCPRPRDGRFKEAVAGARQHSRGALCDGALGERREPVSHLRQHPERRRHNIHSIKVNRTCVPVWARSSASCRFKDLAISPLHGDAYWNVDASTLRTSTTQSGR